MNSTTSFLIEFAYERDVVIVIPRPRLDGVRCEPPGDEFLGALSSLLVDPAARYAVVDLEQVPCLNSALLGFIVANWKTMKRRGGTMVMCGVRPLGRNVFEAMRLTRLWPIVRSRAEAIQAIQAAQQPVADVIDEAADESFPASDSPSWTPIVGEARWQADLQEVHSH